jgi:ABC-2 type transport system ATP-binding protein
VEIDGRDLFREGATLRRRGGYLPEHNPLYPEMSPRDALRFFGGLYGLRGEALRRACAGALADFGLAGVASRPARELSKGYRQRLGLALALVHDPDIVFLDEPTAGLDPMTVRELRDLIRGLGRDKTVLISTHILSEVEALCDRVLILSEGRAAAEGSLAQLSRSMTGGGRYELCVAFPGGEAPDWEASGLVREARRQGEDEPSRWTLLLEPGGEAPAELAAWIHARGGRLYALEAREVGLEEIFLDALRGREPS